jgi:quinol monooxygenase YgiN
MTFPANWRETDGTNENHLFIFEEWDTQADLDRYLKSERFKVLRGAMSLLQEPCETVFHTISEEK